MIAARALSLLALLASLAASPAAGQALRGTLVDETSNQPVADATVRLLDATGERATTTTDAAGAWQLALPAGGGPFRVRAQKEGYATVETSPFAAAGAAPPIALRTRPEVPVLAGVSVPAVNYAGLLSRQRHQMGQILVPDEVRARIARLGATKPSELVDALVPGLVFDRDPASPSPSRSTLLLPTRAGGRPCPATLVIDGKRYEPRDGGGRPRLPPWELDRLVDLDEVRGVEVYHEPLSIPASLGLTNLNPGLAPPCGVVLVWTRAGLGVD